MKAPVRMSCNTELDVLARLIDTNEGAVGQRNKVDQKLVEEELVKRTEEYNSLEMFVLLKQCEVQKVCL
ncbi:hypothetical protein RND71_040929 [Anisodus tanguticus]|uniref:Uncharacterized protein n=1 Tax=Anisodus tanguticus TaxID=243964 RepID=A0AAE1QWN3_9SOLA|nr:hypothetical protein RND71_040929 [Anisodus tanguticus]